MNSTTTRFASTVPANVTSAPPVVLVLDDDVVARRRIARMLSPGAIARPVGSLEDARLAFAGTRIAAIVASLDVDPGVFAWLEGLRTSGKAPVVLAVATTVDIAVASRASAVGIQLADKGSSDRDLAERVQCVVHEARRHMDAQASLVGRLSQQAHLTPAEIEVLRLYVELGGNRADLADRLGIAETSVRSRVRGVCRKLDIPHLTEAYRLLFEVALAS